jgi:DNA invertase Pin-like site-specific DNA recombinase
VKNIIGYGRASTAAQEISCKAQEEIVGSYVNHKQRLDWADYKYLGFIADEGVSGSVPLFERPGGQRLARNISQGDLLVVSHFDRAFRSNTDCAETVDRLNRFKIGLCILDLQVDSTTPTGEAILKVMSAVKELERKETGRRTKDARAHKLRNKKKLGAPPLGWKGADSSKDANLIPDDMVRAIGRYIVDLRENHNLGFNKIGDTLLRNHVRWPMDHHCSPGKFITSACTTWRLYRCCKMGWPCTTQAEVNRMWAEKHESNEPAQLRHQRAFSHASLSPKELDQLLASH